MWKKKAAIAVVIFAVLLGALAALVHSNSFRQWILARVIVTLSTADARFSARNLNYDLASLRFTLEDVSYTTDALELRVDRAAVDLPRTMPSSDSIRITELEAGGVHIRIRSPRGGAGPQGSPAVPATLPDLRIDRLLIRDGSISIDRDGEDPIEIPAFSLDLAGNAGTLSLGEPIRGLQPGLSFSLDSTPVRFDSTSVNFGPADWKAEHPRATVQGAAEGVLQWSPQILLKARWNSQPADLVGWRKITTSGALAYSGGALQLDDVSAVSDQGRLTGSATIGPERNSASAAWSAVNLAPLDIPAVTTGNLNLAWSSADFNDAAGSGQLRISSRKYGEASGPFRIEGRKARLNILASGFDTRVRANLVATMEQAISGTFQAEYPALNAVARGTVQGTFTNPRATASVVVNKLKFAELPPVAGGHRPPLQVDATADIDATIRGITARNVVARSGESVAKGEGSLTFDGMRLDGSLPDVSISLADFVPEASGTVTLSAALSGTPQGPQAKFSGSAGQPVEIRGVRLESVELEGALEGDVLRIDRFRASQGSNEQLEASGTINTKSRVVAANAVVTGFRLDRFQDLQGNVALRASVQGAFDRPQVQFDGAADGLAFRGEPLGDLAFDGVVDGMDVRVNAVSKKFSATTNATVRAEAPYPFDVKVNATESLVHYRDYSARVNGILGLAGQLQPFKLSDVVTDRFRIQAEGAKLEASGRISEQIQVAADLNLEELPIEGVDLTGSATANIAVRGPLTDPLIEGRISTDKATIFTEGMRFPARIQASADFNRTEVVIDTMRAEWGSATAQIKGRGDTRGIGQYSFTIENLRPNELFTDLPIAGVLDLDGTARVNALALAGIEAEASLAARELVVSGVPLRQTERARLTLSKGAVEVGKLEVEGGRTRFSITGSANVVEPAVDFTAAGTTDLEVLEGFIPDMQIAGTATSNVRIQGPPSDPQLTGFVDLADVQVRRQSPALIVTGGSGRIQLQGRTARLLRISADLNDGVVTAGGTVALTGDGIGKTVLDLAGENIRWQYPDGLEAEVSTNLQLNGSGNDFLISGEIRAIQAVYGRDIDLTQEVFNQITAPVSTGPDAAGASLFDATRLSIDVRIPGEVLVLNNLANLQLIGEFRLAGTVAEPVITGRLQSLEGGEIYFGPATEAGRTGRDAYLVEQGLIDLLNPRETEPVISFVANRDVKDSLGKTHRIRLRVNGTIGDLKTEFTSDSEPPLSEDNIVALILTGYTVEQAYGRELTLARNQAIGYLSGVIQRSDFFESTGQALGLDTVRIDPFLVANETDLGARLTIGKDITSKFSLIFSQGLSGSEGQTWIAQYNAFKGFQLRGVNDSVDQEVRAEVTHQIDFGGPSRAAVPRHIFQTRRLGVLAFDETAFPERELRDLVTKPGKPFSAFQLQQDIEKLESFFVGRDYLNVQIRGLRQYRDDDVVDVTYQIQPGSRVVFQFDGAAIPDSVRQELRKTWNTGLFEEQTLSSARLLLMRYLVGEHYFKAGISVTRSDAAAGAVLYTFAIDPGPRFSPPQWVFRGAEEAQAMDIQASPGEVVYGGDAVRGRIENHYRTLGYMDVRVEGPALEFKEQQAIYGVNVMLGPRYSVGELLFNGNVFLSDERLRQAARSSSEPPLPTDTWIRGAARAVESAYWREGFNDVQVKASVGRLAAEGRASVAFDITEGPRQVISDIAISGDRRSDQRFVRSLLAFKTGDPVDHEKINQTRKRLYDTGLFRSVELVVERQANDEYLARVTVVENAPWRFRYGLAYTDKLQVQSREIGLSTDITYTNLFGRGVTTGTSFRYDAATREVRLFSGLPSLIGRDVRTNFSVFAKRDLSDDFFIADEIGFVVQQQWQVRNSFIFAYDYNYRRNRTYERNLDPDNPFAFDLTIPVARFNASVSRDTRDDILNATRGTFLSNNFELAPPGVGSGIRFLKNYAQFFSFRPLKERVTWASGIRVGLSTAFGGEQLIPTEQFSAGGSTSVRGFKQNELTPDRGNASVVLNQELRFPLAWWFSGASFIEAGNVYPLARDFNPFKLRYSPGVGIRVQTPFVLIRFDVGFNPSRRPGEDPYRFSFGIGQAF